MPKSPSLATRSDCPSTGSNWTDHSSKWVPWRVIGWNQWGHSYDQGYPAPHAVLCLRSDNTLTLWHTPRIGNWRSDFPSGSLQELRVQEGRKWTTSFWSSSKHLGHGLFLILDYTGTCLFQRPRQSSSIHRSSCSCAKRRVWQLVQL